MEKNWIVVELSSYNECGVNAFSKAFGPYTEQQAMDKAHILNEQDYYATTYRVIKLRN